MPERKIARYVFDMDGTLVDTRRAVEEAYALVGVTMPKDAWGKPWESWLRTGDGRPNHAAHTAKGKVYPDFLSRLARPTRLLRFAVSNRCPVLTGASRVAVEAIEACFGVSLNVGGYNMTLEDKVAWLQFTEDTQPAGYYIDDDETTRRRVNEETSWRVLCPDHASQLLCLPPERTLG